MVIGDLAEMGYDCEWCIVSASNCGAPHQRDRFWLVAHAKGEQRWQGGKQPHVSGKDGRQDRQLRTEPCCTSEQSENVAHATSQRLPTRGNNSGQQKESEPVDSCQELADTNNAEQQARIAYGMGEKESANASARSCCNKELADTTSQRQQGSRQSWFGSDPAEKREGETDCAFAERVGHQWGIESPLGRVADGVAARVDRLKAIGNGQVPVVAATAFRILTGE